MGFLDDLKTRCYEIAQPEILEEKILSAKTVSLEPIIVLSEKLTIDLDLKKSLKFEELEDSFWVYFNHLIHSGIATAIASRYDRNNIDLIYSLESVENKDFPSYGVSLAPIQNEYSFNLRYNLLESESKFEHIYYRIIDYINENIPEINKQNIKISEIIEIILIFAGLIGVELVNRIDLTKDDYWPIRKYIIINDKGIENDSDLKEIDQLGKYDENVIEDNSKYQIRCPFCGGIAINFPKVKDPWSNLALDPCEHFAFGFITNTGNQLFGRNYYKRFLKRSFRDYVETYKGFSCDNNTEIFLNDFFNGDTDLHPSELDDIIKMLKSDLPDCNIIIKKFNCTVNKRNHVFTFHFLKFAN